MINEALPNFIYGFQWHGQQAHQQKPNSAERLRDHCIRNKKVVETINKLKAGFIIYSYNLHPAAANLKTP